MNFSEKEIPENVRRRLDLFKMFYPLKRKYERRWAKTFQSSFETIKEKFKELSVEKNYRHEDVHNHLILWRDKEDFNVECMFYFINDITNFEDTYQLFKYIDKYKSFLTYAVVHQKKDGEGAYDIFRFSKFSYLEHCNRVHIPLKKGE
jgi:hypothetical protein